MARVGKWLYMLFRQVHHFPSVARYTTSLTQSRDSGVAAIESLMQRRGHFDYILLETTGLADPGNLAPLFWVDDGLGSTIYLDGIVTLVDAKNILKCLDEPTNVESANAVDFHGEYVHQGPELSIAHLQLSHADVIILNKADLVNTEDLELLTDRIKSINSLAKIHTTQYGQVPQLDGVILDLRAYQDVDATALDFASKGHSHLDPLIGTTTLTVPLLTQTSLSRLETWLRTLLWRDLEVTGSNKVTTVDARASTRTDIHRIKGRLRFRDGPDKLIQGVREVFEIIDDQSLDTNADSTHIDDKEQKKQGKIVIIGLGMGLAQTRLSLQQDLDNAIADS